MNDNSIQQKVYTVAELTRSIKRTLEGRAEFNNLWVKGEIFNLTVHSSGHIYFSLRDNDAVISAVFFRHANRNLTFKLKEGMNILALGSITVYEKRGSYQINVSMVKQEGLGELQKRIEMLKQKLAAEGVFSPERKRPIPFLPRRLGIATSPTGAAVQDIIKVALRRYPTIEIIIAPAVVQGVDAPVSIARAIEELNRPEYRIDCIIAGRGGGSFEDLMPFNEEPVVRAVLASRVPVISAVGHQIDHPLSDDAADYAAPTPSAAAEIAVPVKSELVEEIEYLSIRASSALASRLSGLGERLDAIAALRCFRNPREIVAMRELSLVDLEQRMTMALKEGISAGRQRLLSLPDLYRLWKTEARSRRSRLELARGAVDKLSPKGVLRRGYSLVTDARGRVIKTVKTIKSGESIGVMVADGSMGCTVNTVQREVRGGKEIIGKG